MRSSTNILSASVLKVTLVICKILLSCFHVSQPIPFGRHVTHKPYLEGGIRGNYMKDNTFPGSPAPWAGGFITTCRCPQGAWIGLGWLALWWGSDCNDIGSGARVASRYPWWGQNRTPSHYPGGWGSGMLPDRDIESPGHVAGRCSSSGSRRPDIWPRWRWFHLWRKWLRPPQKSTLGTIHLVKKTRLLYNAS